MGTYFHAGEADADDEISHPVDQHGDGHGAGPRALREQLGGDHPRDRAGTHGEEYHKTQRRYNR